MIVLGCDIVKYSLALILFLQYQTSFITLIIYFLFSPIEFQVPTVFSTNYGYRKAPYEIPNSVQEIKMQILHHSSFTV